MARRFSAEADVLPALIIATSLTTADGMGKVPTTANDTAGLAAAGGVMETPAIPGDVLGLGGIGSDDGSRPRRSSSSCCL